MQTIETIDPTNQTPLQYHVQYNTMYEKHSKMRTSIKYV